MVNRKIALGLTPWSSDLRDDKRWYIQVYQGFYIGYLRKTKLKWGKNIAFYRVYDKKEGVQ